MKFARLAQMRAGAEAPCQRTLQSGVKDYPLNSLSIVFRRRPACKRNGLTDEGACCGTARNVEDHQGGCDS